MPRRFQPSPLAEVLHKITVGQVDRRRPFLRAVGVSHRGAVARQARGGNTMTCRFLATSVQDLSVLCDYRRVGELMGPWFGPASHGRPRQPANLHGVAGTGVHAVLLSRVWIHTWSLAVENAHPCSQWCWLVTCSRWSAPGRAGRGHRSASPKPRALAARGRRANGGTPAFVRNEGVVRLAVDASLRSSRPIATCCLATCGWMRLRWAGALRAWDNRHRARACWVSGGWGC